MCVFARYLVCGVCCLHAVGQSSCLPAWSRFAKQPQLILATSTPPPVLSSRLLSSHTRRVTVMSAKGVTFLPNFNHVWLFIWPCWVQSCFAAFSSASCCCLSWHPDLPSFPVNHSLMVTVEVLFLWCKKCCYLSVSLPLFSPIILHILCCLFPDVFPPCLYLLSFFPPLRLWPSFGCSDEESCPVHIED